MFEDYGLVSCKVYLEILFKVEYFLIELGVDFILVFEQFKVWGDKYIEMINVKSDN